MKPQLLRYLTFGFATVSLLALGCISSTQPGAQQPARPVEPSTPFAMITGSVTTEDGEPLADVRIVVRPRARPPITLDLFDSLTEDELVDQYRERVKTLRGATRTVTTDAQGRYVCWVDPTFAHRVEAQMEGWLLWGEGSGSCWSGEEVHFLAYREMNLPVTVLHPDGTEVDSATCQTDRTPRRTHAWREAGMDTHITSTGSHRGTIRSVSQSTGELDSLRQGHRPGRARSSARTANAGIQPPI